MTNRIRNILEQLEQTREDLLAVSDDIWLSIDHNDTEALEDRCTLRTGHGPENSARPRRFATGPNKTKSKDSVATTPDTLPRKVRHVFDDLGMTANSVPVPPKSRLSVSTDLPRGRRDQRCPRYRTRLAGMRGV